MMFTILRVSGLSHHFDRYEKLALMIGCFCHDLDHRGTNNSFEITNSSPLAHLYSTSTMEHHHFDQCLLILNSPGNQILGALSPTEYGHTISMLEESILATDLAVYMQHRAAFIKHHSTLRVSLQANKRQTLRAMLMTICDFNAVSKPWKVQKHIAKLVAEEFFRQGDVERQLFNRRPADLFDREKRRKMPQMQVEFIGDICQPLYEHFRRLIGPSFVYRDFMLINKVNWVREAAQEPTLKEWAVSKMKEIITEFRILQVSTFKLCDEAIRQMPVVDYVAESELLQIMGIENNSKEI